METESSPVSSAQESVWFQEQLQPDVAVYNIPLLFRLRGPLAVDALRAALSDVVARHDALRSYFPSVDGYPAQLVAESVAVPWVVEDVSALGQREVLRRAELAAHTPFDLADPPLVRALLLRVGEHEHLLVLTVHHIVFDGWSQGVLVRELAHFYGVRSAAGGPAGELPGPVLQYADFVAWQHDCLRSGAWADQLAYWRERLADAPPVLELPTDRPRPAVQSFRGGCERTTIPAELVAELRELCRREGVTLFMLLLAAFNVLLTRYTGQRDVVVGVPIANRTQAELEPVVGFLVNTVALRNDLAGDPTVTDVLGRVRDTFLDAYANQDLPFERLVEELHPARDLSRTPLVQVMFSLHSRGGLPGFPGLSVEEVQIDPGSAKFDISMFFTEAGDDLSGGIEYRADLFDAATVRRMLGHYTALLSSMVHAVRARISELRMLPAAELRDLVLDRNATDEEWAGDVRLHELFEAQADRTPDNVAVVSGDDSVTYRELDQRANQLAWWLRERGIGPGHVVGVCVDRSADMVVGPLAVLKAGAAYLPLDPAYPLVRTAFVLDDADVGLVVTQDHLAPRFAGHDVFSVDGDRSAVTDLPARRPDRDVAATDLAYVIYTSGSTGRPKGVLVEHHSVVNLVRSLNAAIGLAPADRLVAVTTVSFDITVYDIFGPLACGAAVVIAPRETTVDGRALGELLDRSAATVMEATPATWRMLLADGWRGDPALRILSGGEALSGELAQELVRRTGAVWNIYGTTETTVWSTLAQVDAATRTDFTPIGRPLANTRVYVVDEDMNVVPVGVPGELLIGGVGVCRSYLNRPDLNEERFVADPFRGTPGARLYRTGDLARYNADGTLELLGRRDHQVKLRGFRIELGEIESVLARVPGVTGSAAILREDTPGDARIVAYFTTEGDAVTAGSLRRALQAELPEYMVPAAFVELDELPLSINRKVDRAKLPPPDETPRDAGSYLAPRTETERVLTEVFAEVLQLPAATIGVHDDFFKLGGHSLLAARVVARAQAALPGEVSLRDVFRHPTIAQLATAVAGHPAAAAGEQETPPGVVRPRPAGAVPPLTTFQEQLWFTEQFAPGAAGYSIVPAQRWRGPLDEDALRTALGALVARHEALRMSFPAGEDGAPAVAISDTGTVDLTLVEGAAPGDARSGEERAVALVAAEAVRPFDLEAGPLVRATLIRLADEDHVLALAVHHIVCDGWSIDVLLGELSALYAEAVVGVPADLPRPDVQFGDYAVWHQARLAGGDLDAAREYWMAELADVPALELPTDRPRPDRFTHTAGSVGFHWDRGLTEGLTRVGAARGATLYMVLMAAYQAALAHYSGQRDFAVGSPSAGRVRPELHGVVGTFVNMLPIRARLGGDPAFEEIVDRVKERSLPAFEHQELPFVEMLAARKITRDTGQSPIFQATFALQNFDAEWTSGNVTPERPDLPRVENFAYPYTRTRADLSLYVAEDEDGLAGLLLYRDRLWDRDSVVRFVRGFEALVTVAAAAPGTPLSLLPPVPADSPSAPAVTNDLRGSRV